MIRTLFMAFVALTIAACTAPQPAADANATFVGIDGRPLVLADGSTDASVQEALTADAAACAKAGGEVGPVCRLGRPMCVITFADAGKACTDGSQCGSGRCYAATPVATSGGEAKGQCSANNNPCGCNQRVEDGVALPTLCVD